MAETSTMTAHYPVQQWPRQEYQIKTIGFSCIVYMCKESKVVQTIIGHIHILDIELEQTCNGSSWREYHLMNRLN